MAALALGHEARVMVHEAAWVARCVGRGEWAPLSNGDLEDLAARLSTRIYEAGEQLFAQGQEPDGVYIVREGRVELVWRGSMRRRLVVQILHPGDVEGDICTILAIAPPYSARALDRVEALVISPADLEALLTRPQVSRRWLSSVAARLVHSQRRILQLQDHEVRGKVASLLLDEERGGVVELPQESLAALLSVRRQAVNGALREFERAGLVRTSYRLVRIEDRAGLESVAGRRASREHAA
ncbi:MAG TPA: Crp/Fnr family transcriptional regulator [Actinomycetota bacterium]